MKTNKKKLNEQLAAGHADEQKKQIESEYIVFSKEIHQSYGPVVTYENGEPWLK